MSARLTPYDNGTRLEPHVWVRGDVATPGGLPRRTEEDDYGRVDLDDDEGRTVLTLYVERTAEGLGRGGLALGLMLVLAGEIIGRGLFYGLHMTVGMAVAG